MRPERGLVARAALEAPDGSLVVRRLRRTRPRVQFKGAHRNAGIERKNDGGGMASGEERCVGRSSPCSLNASGQNSLGRYPGCANGTGHRRGSRRGRRPRPAADRSHLPLLPARAGPVKTFPLFRGPSVAERATRSRAQAPATCLGSPPTKGPSTEGDRAIWQPSRRRRGDGREFEGERPRGGQDYIRRPYRPGPAAPPRRRRRRGATEPSTSSKSVTTSRPLKSYELCWETIC